MAQTLMFISWIRDKSCYALLRSRVPLEPGWSLALAPYSSSIPSRVCAKPCRCGARVWVDVQVGSASGGGACGATLYYLLQPAW